MTAPLRSRPSCALPGGKLGRRGVRRGASAARSPSAASYSIRRLTAGDSAALQELHGAVLGAAWLYESELCDRAASGSDGWARSARCQ